MIYFLWIKLVGVWFEDVGFEVGECVWIIVEDKWFIIMLM